MKTHVCVVAMDAAAAEKFVIDAVGVAPDDVERVWDLGALDDDGRFAAGARLFHIDLAGPHRGRLTHERMWVESRAMAS